LRHGLIMLGMKGIILKVNKEGKGKLFFADNSVYEGEFSDNEINGTGVYEWTDGKKYTGTWVNNKMSGKGKLQWKDGK